MLSCSIWFSAPSSWMGGGLESRCVGRVCGADDAVHQMYIEEYCTEYDHSIGAYSKLSMRSRCLLYFTY